MKRVERIKIGPVNAYALAVLGGYTGTLQQFEEDQAHFAENATAVANAVQEAKNVKSDVTNIAESVVEIKEDIEDVLDTIDQRIEDANIALSEAEKYVKQAHSYAKVESGETVDADRPDELVNNAWYWSEQARVYSERMQGGITYVGSIYFADIPEIPTVGDQYDIKDAFTTDERFIEGAGIECDPGTDITFGSDGKWSVSAPTGVITFKGRKGNVIPQIGDYTAQMVGALPNVNGSEGQVISFDANGNPIARNASLGNVQPDWNQADPTASDYIKNKPDIIAGGGVQPDWNQDVPTAPDYIKNKPTSIGNVQPDWEQDDPNADDYIKNKPDISSGSGDENVQSDWEQDDSTADDYIKNKPTIVNPVQPDWNQDDSTALDYIKNKPQISEGGSNVQSDWNQDDTTADDYIKNKPTLGTAALKDAGSASGVAELDANGKVPSSQLPSYVDDVIEGHLDNGAFYDNSPTPVLITGESGKIYVDTTTNKSYRWTGSIFAAISSDIALGETASTAYRGDRGAEAYAHATDVNRIATATQSGLYKIGVTDEGHVASVTPVTKADITGLGVAGDETLDDKVDTVVEGTNGDSSVFNEDGLIGIRFEGDDGTTSSIYVRDESEDGITGGISSLQDGEEEGELVGSRIIMTSDGFYYTNGETDDSYSADDEIATKGDIPDEQIQSDWNQEDSTAKDYIKNKPAIPETVQLVQSDWEQDDSTAMDYIKNKPNIPSSLNQEQVDWDQTDSTAVDYIKNKPTIPDAQIQSDWTQTDNTAKDYIRHKPTIPEVLQSDWNQSDTNAIDYIKNKPETFDAIMTEDEIDALIEEVAEAAYREFFEDESEEEEEEENGGE